MAMGVSGNSSQLEDDVLELSRRVVKGFVCRVVKYRLYITFTFWANRARKMSALGVEAYARWQAKVLKRSWRAWQGYMSSRSDRERLK